MQRFAWMSARTVSQAAAAATAITAELMTRPADATPTEAASEHAPPTQAAISASAPTVTRVHPKTVARLAPDIFLPVRAAR